MSIRNLLMSFPAHIYTLNSSLTTLHYYYTTLYKHLGYLRFCRRASRSDTAESKEEMIQDDKCAVVCVLRKLQMTYLAILLLWTPEQEQRGFQSALKTTPDPC